MSTPLTIAGRQLGNRLPIHTGNDVAPLADLSTDPDDYTTAGHTRRWGQWVAAANAAVEDTA